MNINYGQQPFYSYSIPQPPNPKKIEQNHLRATASRAGTALIFFLVIQVIISIIAVPIMLLTGVIGTSGLSTTTSYWFSGFIYIISFLVPSLILSKQNRYHFDDLVHFNKVGFKKYFPLMLACFAFVFVANFLLSILNANLSIFGFNNTLDMGLEHNTLQDNILMFLTIAILPAFLEEYLFRGVILGSLRKFGDGFAIILSSILFGLMHGNFVQLPVTFLMGLVLGALTVYTNSMLPAMILHFINNAIACVFEIAAQQIGEHYSNLIYTVLLFFVLILGICSIFYMAKKDTKILQFEKSTSLLTLKEKLTTSFSSGGIIIASIIFLGECVIMASGMVTL